MRTKKLLWLLLSLGISVILVGSIALSLWNPRNEPLRLTSSTETSLSFSRTVYDPDQVKDLEQVNQTLVFAGPLFRPPGTPSQLIEMTPALELSGAKELEDNYFFAAAPTSQGSLNFMGGGCAAPSGAWATCSVVTSLTAETEVPLQPSTELGLDFHEYEPDGAGGYWAIQYQSVSCASDIKHCGVDADGAAVQAIGDCNVVHVEDGNITSRWSAFEHLPAGESTSSRYKEYSDVFHCNSIDALILDGKTKLLISMRNTDSIYLLDASSGTVEWKLGGKEWPGVSLTIANPGTIGAVSAGEKPEQVLSGQHDARYWGNGVFSVFDNGSATGRAARGLVFAVEPSSDTALITQVFTDPEGNPSGCTGSFRQLNHGKYWVAGWGCSPSGVTVFDADTTPIVSTQLNQKSSSVQEITNPQMGPLQWTLSYRVIVE